MFSTDGFRLVLEKLSSPILVLEPLPQKAKSGATRNDFSVVFMKESFRRFFGEDNCFDKLSSYKENEPLSSRLIELVETVMETGIPIEKTFRSKICGHWFKLIIDKIEDALFSVTFINVDDDKKFEERLAEQNRKLKDLSEKLEFNAFHDMMTGLLGRKKFESDFLEWASKASSLGQKFGIMLADLDDMKIINDSRGHSAGDELIVKAAEILKKIETEDMRAYRFGSDEFIIMMNKIESHGTALNMGNLILELFNERGVEFSAGIAVYPDDGTDFEKLLRYTDMAMLDSKKHGKNRVGIFQNVMQDRFMKKLSIQNKLNDAYGKNAFQSDFRQYYQPQYDIATGKLRGFEALLRWHDESLGWISPEQFIPIAEETRLMVPLGEWVMEMALKSLREWIDDYGFDGIMSVNVSPVQLKKPTFIFDLSNFIEQYQIPTKNLEIEITEGVFIDNKEEILGTLSQVRAMGIGISLDDFGTGYSSLSYLQKLPITALKIDKSFISNIGNLGFEADITDTIVSLVSKMGLDTIAEGVENEEQLSVLRKIKCRVVQGFLKGKPMTKEDCENIFRDTQGR